MRVTVIIAFLLFVMSVKGQEPSQDYVFFSNSLMLENYFYSSVDTSGGSQIRTLRNRLPVVTGRFHTPGNSLLLAFKDATGGKWTASIYRPDVRGQDHFRTPKYLSFYLLNTAGKEWPLPRVSFLYRDSTESEYFEIPGTSSSAWQRKIISIEQMKPKSVSRAQDLIGIVFSQKGTDGKYHELYIDDIELTDEIGTDLSAKIPALTQAKGYLKHVELTWNPVADPAIRYVQVYRSTDNRNFIPVGIEQPWVRRFSDYTNQTGKTYYYKLRFLDRDYRTSSFSKTLSAATHRMSDEELMTMVQEATFHYYWEGAESTTGLARENIPGRQNMIATGASGFGVMALLVGTERQFISREESVQRFLRIIQFLQSAQTFHGAFPHFIDGPTGKVETFFGRRDNGADLVETSFLLQGLLAARNYFTKATPEEQGIRDGITAIWKKVEWDWFRKTPDSKFLYWHWSPDQGWVINHNLIGWNETMVTYLLAIASPTHSVPASMYYSGWANQDSTGIRYRSAWGGTMDGAHYTNGNKYFGVPLAVGVANGGPLFFTHYSYLGYDPHLITDRYTNYFINNKNIVDINLRYAESNPHHYPGYGDSCWGMTACDGPYDYSADEPRASRDPGKVAPTGAISSFPYLPKPAMKALRNYYNQFGFFLWGAYGFRDAFSLKDNWCSGIYMGLNQAPMTVMIENYRTGLIWKLLSADPDVKAGLEKLNAETNRK